MKKWESVIILYALPKRNILFQPIQKYFELHIKDIVINNGAEMIVAIAGEIMRMPGLPKEPQALHIDIVDGNIEGLS